MYQDFDKTVNNQIIVLNHLLKDKNDFYNFNGYFNTWRRERVKGEKEKNKSDEEIKKEVEKEIFEEKEILVKESQKYNYKISEEKNKELETFFKSPKLKVNLCKPTFLGNGKICGISGNKYIIYESNYMNKLFEIELENTDNVKSVIELDNHDLIFMSSKRIGESYWNYDYELFIYRLKDKNYYLFQTIKENEEGYAMQRSYSGCLGRRKIFSLLNIRKFSGNRFLSISNYGIRLYSIDNNSNYSLVLMETHLEGIEIIYEINENQFIFCTRKNYGDSLGGPSFDEMIIEKVDIKELEGKKAKDSKEAITSSLKLTSSFKTLFEYSTYGGRHRFSNFVDFQKKYFLIFVDYHLLIFDLLNNKLIKRYTILENGTKNLYYDKYLNIFKWQKNNNEFLITKKGNLILFELNENCMDLKVIGYTNFDNAFDLNIDENNRFYISSKIKDKNCISFY